MNDVPKFIQDVEKAMAEPTERRRRNALRQVYWLTVSEGRDQVFAEVGQAVVERLQGELGINLEADD